MRRIIALPCSELDCEGNDLISSPVEALRDENVAVDL
jgi:hypothetical protein